MFDYRVEDGFVRITLRGTLKLDEILAKRAEMRRSPEVGNQSAILVDATGIGEIALSAEEVRELALGGSPFLSNSGIRIAIAAGSSEVFGLARMYQLSRGDDVEIQVFDHVGDAERWAAAAIGK